MEDIAIVKYPEECFYKTVLKTEGSDVTVFFLTDSDDEALISKMKGACLELIRKLPAIDRMVRNYLKENLNEETLDIYREYRKEPGLSKKDMEDNLRLGLIRIEEDGSSEYDYVYDKGEYLTRLIFRGTDEKDFEFRFSCTEEKE